MTTIGDVVTKLSDTGRGEVVDSLTALGIDPDHAVLVGHNDEALKVKGLHVMEITPKEGDGFDSLVITI